VPLTDELVEEIADVLTVSKQLFQDRPVDAIATVEQRVRVSATSEYRRVLNR
jgi:hypothetical protein